MRPRLVHRHTLALFPINLRSVLRHASMVTALTSALATSLQLQAQTSAVSLVPVITTVAGNGLRLLGRRRPGHQRGTG